MIQRPKNTDSMDDVLKMQQEFLKAKDEKPAAEVIKCKRATEPKQSEFAKRRNLKKQSDNQEKKLKTEDIVMGDIVERKYDKSSLPERMEMDEEPSSSDRGFPKPNPIDVRSCAPGTRQKSIFSQLMSGKAAGSGPSRNPATAAPKSRVLNDTDMQEIHEQNEKRLKEMSEAEILQEQQNLMKSLDPKLLDFLKTKKTSQATKKTSEIPSKKSVTLKEPSELPKIEESPALDFLKQDVAKNWLHFDVFEPEKLEWTKDIEQTFANLKEGETFEARFDWKGFLLPYIDRGDQKTSEKDDRELYLHGEDPHRPGYALQELFRLARANVLQQRVSALNAIAGILNIYNQGYYDDILELPISKIFFFLRFALDENTPAIVEAAAKGLSHLFYNDTDETLLDIAYETLNGIYQPIIEGTPSKPENIEELEASINRINLSGDKHKLFESNLEDIKDDSELEQESMSDFYLAETNLMECLLRTNIIDRITYILTVMEPDEVTILSCLKLLIRISRTGRDFALKVLNRSRLVESLIGKFLSVEASENSPNFIVMKLLRILAGYDVSFCVKLKNLGVDRLAKDFLSTRSDININLLKLQIESSRFLRLYFSLIPDESLYGELISPIRYLLEWHYQFLNYDQDNHFIIRQHASSLVYLLSVGNMVVVYPLFSEIFQMCLCKWFTLARRSESNEFSQKLLLSALLDVASKFVTFASEYFFEIIDSYLIKFLQSPVYKKISNLSTTSPFFKNCWDKSGFYKPLPNLGAIIRINKITTLILNQEYSVHFMKALWDSSVA